LNKIQQKAWVTALNAHAKEMHQALDIWDATKNGLVLVNVLFKTINLPINIILPVSRLKPAWTIESEGSADYTIDLGGSSFPSDDYDADPSMRSSSIAKQCRMALSSYKLGKTRSGTRILNGNGTAPKDEDTADVFTDMHPDYGNDDPRPPLPDPAPDIGLSLFALETQLYRSASDRQAGIDVFGWSPGMLLSTRRFPGDLTPLKAFARLLHILGSSHVPEAVAFLLTPGACTALNKIPEEENRVRKSQNLQPKIRPINNGSLFLKNVFRACNNTPSGKLAKRRCEPVQFGTGAKGSPTTMGLAASAAYKARKVIHTDDAQNAFNALRRSSLLASTKAVWPEFSPICNLYYRNPSEIRNLGSDNPGWAENPGSDIPGRGI
jgi:hypothetical protein